MNLYLALIVAWAIAGAAAYFSAPWWVTVPAIIIAAFVTLVVAMFLLLGTT